MRKDKAMLDTKMYVPPKDTKKMTPAEVTGLAFHWLRGTASELAYIVAQTIPHSYVQIRREPETGDEWLHYGTRWLNAEITDTKVKLAPRPERMEQERKDLAEAEMQLEKMKQLCEEQRKRVNVLDVQDQSNT